jgi:hypothetical protein
LVIEFCETEHLDVLRERGVRLIINVSNIDEPPPNFEYKYIYANDDHTEQLSRIFYESADLIGINIIIMIINK